MILLQWRVWVKLFFFFTKKFNYCEFLTQWSNFCKYSTPLGSLKLVCFLPLLKRFG